MRKRTPSRIRFRGLVGCSRVLVVAVLAFAAITATANAFTATGRGTTGRSTNHFVQGAIYPWAQSQIQFPERRVYRSRAYGGTQRISYYYKIYQWIGATQRYNYVGVRSGALLIPPGGFLHIGPKAIEVWDLSHYTANVSFYWRTPTGRFIGSRNIFYVDRSDYTCAGGATTGVCRIEFVGGRPALFMDGPNSWPNAP